MCPEILTIIIIYRTFSAVFTNGKYNINGNIGYAKGSTLDQDTSLQIKALQQFGCEKIYEDKASGIKTDRPELLKAISYLRESDVLVVWKLDRLGRSMKHLIQIINDLEDHKIGLNVREAAARIKVSKTTLYKALNIKKSYE